MIRLTSFASLVLAGSLLVACGQSHGRSDAGMDARVSTDGEPGGVRPSDGPTHCGDTEWFCGGGAGSCTDIAGGYHCTCFPGFSAPPIGGTCTDIDECAGGMPCGAAGVSCTNTYGSYQCTCAAGYAAPVYGGPCTMTDACVLSMDGGCG